VARQRMLKPEFFTDEDLARCSLRARLLFAGLWTLADKRGRLRDQPPVIFGALFPFDADADVDGCLSELAYAGFICRYEVAGKRYLQVVNFERHQNPHPKEVESIIPPCQPLNGSAVKSNGSAVKSDVLSRAESESFPSESVSMPETLPALPPADKAERAIRQSTDCLRTKLYALVSAAVDLDPKQRDATELMRLFTAYARADGTQVKGVVNAALLTHERLERSCADAEGQIAEWKAAKHGA
jgi:hypothetical protein